VVRLVTREVRKVVVTVTEERERILVSNEEEEEEEESVKTRRTNLPAILRSRPATTCRTLGRAPT